MATRNSCEMERRCSRICSKRPQTRAARPLYRTTPSLYWAGHDGFVRRTKASFRGPAFEGDVTYFQGEVIAKEAESSWGVPLATVKVRLANQVGGVLVDATAEVELPL